ncbi:MAG: hypothetical protein V4858_28715 [Pseudomonadota bacterium]
MKISIAFLVASAVLALPAWAGGSVDAGRLVFPVCQSCHTDPVTASRFTPYRFNASELTAAFQRTPQMNVYVDLGPQTINDLAAYLGAPTSNDTDRLLDWGEDTFPAILSPRRQITGQLMGYTYRFYPDTGVYAGTKDGDVWFYESRAPGAPITRLGTMRSYLDQMPNNR